MKIVICMKQIWMPYARTGSDPENFFLSPEDKICRINPYDEVALEIALNIKEALGGGEITIMTLGPLVAENELRRCLAMGADNLYQIDMENNYDPWTKSVLLARGIRDLGADMVLCGKESLDSGNGQVGAFIAHRLGIPFVSAVTDILIRRNQTIMARRSGGRGIREVVECSFPALCSVDLGVHEPRLPTYEAKKKALLSDIRKLKYTGDLQENKTSSMGVFLPRPRPKKIPGQDSSLGAFDRIQQLLAGTRIEKKGVILRGSPESQVEEIISFLKDHGFLEFKKDI